MGVRSGDRRLTAAARGASLARALRAHEHRSAALLLGLLVLAYLWPALVQGHLLSPTALLYLQTPFHAVAPAGIERWMNGDLGDPPYTYYPWDVLARELVRAGTFPAWNAHAFAGTPLWANSQVAWLSPFSLPLWILPLHYGLGVAAALKLWCAGFGTYLLARELRLAFWPALRRGDRVRALLVQRRVAHVRDPRVGRGDAAVDAVADRADRAPRPPGRRARARGRDDDRAARRPPRHAGPRARRDRRVRARTRPARARRRPTRAAGAARARRRRARGRACSRRRSCCCRPSVRRRAPSAPRRAPTGRRGSPARRCRSACCAQRCSPTGGAGRARASTSAASPATASGPSMQARRRSCSRWSRCSRPAAGGARRRSRCSASSPRPSRCGCPASTTSASACPASTTCRTRASTGCCCWRSRCWRASVLQAVLDARGRLGRACARAPRRCWQPWWRWR